MAEPQRLYWDASVFIKLISNRQTPEAVEARLNCERFFQDAINSKAVIITSTLTLVEVLRTEVEAGAPVPPTPLDVRQRIAELFEEPYILLVLLEPARATEARELRWRYPWLKTADAIQVASAIYSKVEVMHTYDGAGGNPRRILQLNGLVGNPPLKVQVPFYQGQQPLPLDAKG